MTIPRRYFFKDHLCFCFLCFSCFRVYSFLYCVHLLGKDWPLGSGLWCLLYFCYFSMWYPGSGVVLDCIVSWSLPSFLLLNLMLTEYYIRNWIKMKIPTNNHCNGNGLVQLIRIGKYILYKWVAPVFSFIYCWVLIFALSPCYILIYMFYEMMHW